MYGYNTVCYLLYTEMFVPIIALVGNYICTFRSNTHVANGRYWRRLEELHSKQTASCVWGKHDSSNIPSCLGFRNVERKTRILGVYINISFKCVCILSNLTTCDCTFWKSVTSDFAGYKSEGEKEMGRGGLKTKFSLQWTAFCRLRVVVGTPDTKVQKYVCVQSDGERVTDSCDLDGM